MPRGIAEVHQASLAQHEHAAAVRQAPLVHLRLDLDRLGARERLQPRHVDLVVEVADVGDDREVLEAQQVLDRDDVLVAGAGHDDVDVADHRSRRATWKPSIAACSAQIGSTSPTMTRAPWPRSASAAPLPTSP